MSKYFTRQILLLVYLVFSHLLSKGQQLTDNYPVQAGVVFSGGYSLKMSDYFTSSTKLQVNLMLKDLSRDNLPVYLKWSIEGLGLGVSVRTAEGFVPSSTISLQKQVLKSLKGIDLRAYFQPGILEVEGVSEGVILNGRLPEGFYTFKVQAIEAITHRIVSNPAEAYFSVSYALPPIINIPMVGTELRPQTPPNVFIQWTPRHLASPNSNIKYQVEIFEVSDGDEPAAATNGIPAVSKQVLVGTSILISTADYQSSFSGFKLGARYAVRVQAIDVNGELEFQNEGKSEVTWFRYGKECVAPQDLKVSGIGPGRVNVSWASVEDAIGYELSYREEGGAWTSVEVVGNSTAIANLKVDKKYYFKVSTHCSLNQDSPVSEEVAWLMEDDETLDPEEEVLINEVFNPLLTPIKEPNGITGTGTPILPENLEDLLKDPTKIPCIGNIEAFGGCSDNQSTVVSGGGTTPQTSLSAGDFLNIYDYLVIITDISSPSGGGGGFSGKGLAKLPFMNNVWVGVEFDNITVMQGAAGTRGGCVSAVGGYFRTRNISQEDLVGDETKILDIERKSIDPTSVYTLLGEVLKKYDETAAITNPKQASGQPLTPTEKETITKCTGWAIQGIGDWKDKVTTLLADITDPRKTGIMADIDALIHDLTTAQTTITGGTSYPTVPNIKTKLADLVERIKELQNTPPVETPQIKNVVAQNITDHTATITWEGDKRFTKYVVTYQKPGEGEVIKIVTGTEIDLQGLTEASNYNIKVEGYVGDELVDDEYKKFTTIDNSIPMPENVKVSISDNGKLKFNWTKNPLHESYILKYTDENGNEKFVYPNVNSTEFSDFEFNKNYKYTIIAIGKNGRRSLPATGDFNFDKNCYRFNQVSINSQLIDATIVSKGTLIKLSVPNEQVASCISTIEWFSENDLIGSGSSINIIANNPKNDYKAKCSQVNNGNNMPITSCESKVLVETMPWCNVATIKASKTTVEAGENVLLIREKDCEEAQSSYWGDIDGKIISNSNNLLIKAIYNDYPRNNVYYLYCVNNGIACRVPSPTLSVSKAEDDCSKVQMMIPRMDEHHILIEAVGCAKVESWELSTDKLKLYSIHKLITQRNNPLNTVFPFTPFSDIIRGRSVLSKFSFPDSYLSQFSEDNTIFIYRLPKAAINPIPVSEFTITATCKKTSEYDCVMSKTINNAHGCQDFQCSSYIATTDINNGKSIEARIASSYNNNNFSAITNMNLANKYASLSAGIFGGAMTLALNAISPSLGPIATALEIPLLELIKKQELEKAKDWDEFITCDGRKFEYYWDELGEKGETKKIDKKPYPQVYHITKNIVRKDAGHEGELLACPQKIELLIPALSTTQSPPSSFELKTIKLENQVDYIFPTNCQNEFEEGFVVLESPNAEGSTQYMILKNSEVTPIKVLPQPWYLKASCILSGHVYIDSYGGIKSKAEENADKINFLSSIFFFLANNTDWVNKPSDPQQTNVPSTSVYTFASNTNPVITPPCIGNMCVQEMITELAQKNFALILNSIIQISKSLHQADLSFDPSAFNSGDLTNAKSSLTTFFPLDNSSLEFIIKNGMSTISSNETYLTLNVTKKILEDICQKIQQYGLGNQSKEILCKVYNELKNNGITVENPLNHPTEIEDFKNGNCASMVSLWKKAETLTMPSSISKQILAQNDAIIQSAGDGECSDDNNKTLTVTANVSKQPTCKNNDGEISVSVSGGSGLYKYKINTSTTYQESAMFTNLKPGSYTIEVMDKQDGSRGESGVLVLNQNNFSYSVTSKKCKCGNDGSIEVYATGGSGSYKYTLLYSNRTVENTTGVFTNLGGDTYSIKVEDTNGNMCSYSQTITLNTITPLQIAETHKNPTCDTKGRINISVTGGTPSYLYSNDDGKTFVDNKGEFLDQTYGVYQLQCKDKNNCFSNSIKVNLPSSGSLVFEQPLEAFDGEYGFDDGSQYSKVKFEAVKTDYEALKVSCSDKDNYYVPWLSLLNSQTVNLKVLIGEDLKNYIASGKKVSLIPSKKITINGKSSIDITKSNLATFNQIAINSNITDSNIDFEGKYNIIAKDEDNKIVGKLNIITGNPDKMEIEVFYIKHNESPYRTDYDKDIIEDLLNKHSHNQAFGKYAVKSEQYVDISNEFINTGVSSDNIFKKLSDSFIEKNISISPSKTIFITNVPIDGVGGVANYLGNFVVLKNSPSDIIMHEMGHVLNLRHTFCCNGEQDSGFDNGIPIPSCTETVGEHCMPKNTSDNFMDYSNRTFRFYKYQWKILYDTFLMIK